MIQVLVLFRKSPECNTEGRGSALLRRGRSETRGVHGGCGLW